MPEVEQNTDAVLVTSHPPLSKQLRRDWRGNLVTVEYAEKCTQSWRYCFSNVLSVNSDLERGLGIERLIDRVTYVDTDLMRQVGKPVVLLDDLLQVSDGVSAVAVINADVYLSPSAGTLTSGIAGNRFFAERRTDTNEIDSQGGIPYRKGYDFIVVPSNLISSISGTDFAIGVPWWDHFVPLALIFSGAAPIGSGIGTAFSLSHEERWSGEVWHSYGDIFVREIQKRLPKVRKRGAQFALYFAVFALCSSILRLFRQRYVSTLALTILSRANVWLIECNRVQ